VLNDHVEPPEAQKKAAMLVMMLETDTLASLLQQLTQHERRQLIEGYDTVSRTSPPSEAELTEIAKSFLQTSTLTRPNRFKDALAVAFGPDAARQMPSASEWTAISQRVKPAAMAGVLRAERPTTAAIILSQMPPQYSAEVLTALPDERRFEIINNLASGLNPPDGVLDAILAALQESVDAIAIVGDEGRGARQAAAMLNQIDWELAEAIVEQIRQQDPARASSIEHQMFHFRDFVRLPSRTLQSVLTEIKPELLALAFKGMNDEERQLVLDALPEQVKAIVVQEMEDAGKVPAREVQGARREIMDLAMQMARDGKIRLRPETDLVG
jgi:flagellar motor switch protein FliG